jgi:hypothetical protein
MDKQQVGTLLLEPYSDVLLEAVKQVTQPGGAELCILALDDIAMALAPDVIGNVGRGDLRARIRKRTEICLDAVPVCLGGRLNADGLAQNTEPQGGRIPAGAVASRGGAPASQIVVKRLD